MLTKDLTTGSPTKLIIGFSIPMLFGYLFQQLYNLVDTVIVGKFLGVDDLAAIGSTGSINFLIIGFCVGICSGFSIPIAQCFGAKDYRALKKYVANSMWLAIIFSAVITVLTVILCRWILEVMKTPENIIDGAYSYIVIIFAGIPVIFLYNIVAGIIRALGDSKTPVIFLVIASIINIFLDLLFILVFNMRLAGAGLATVIAQGISGVLSLIYMIKKFEIVRLAKDDLKLRFSYIKNLFSMGVPMGLQFSITAIGSVILQTSVNVLGSVAVAAVTAANKVGMFFTCPYDALGATMSTYGGQNTGAGNIKRLDKGLKSSIILGAVYSLFAFIILALFAKYFALIFIDSKEAELLDAVYQYLFINAAFYFTLALVDIIRYLIQGMGFSKLSIFSGVCEMIARSLSGIILVPIFKFTAVCFASPIAWVLADMFLIPAYFYCRNKLKKILDKKKSIAKSETKENVVTV